MARIDENYKDILNNILKCGNDYEDPNRKGVIRKEIPFVQINYSLKEGFPILTTREVNFKNIVTELLWFLRGEDDIKYLLDNNCNIWNKDACNYYNKKHRETLTTVDFIKKVNKNTISGSVGKIYPIQWRGTFNGVDQIKKVIELMKTKPMSSEMIVNSWNQVDLETMALPPCHYSFQIVGAPFYGKIGFYLVWNQRSTDFLLGTPYNITSYALLAKILEKLTGLKAIGIVGNLNKVHLYDNQLETANKQLLNNCYKFNSPDLILDLENDSPYGSEFMDLDDFLDIVTPESFRLAGYKSYPKINVPMLARD